MDSSLVTTIVVLYDVVASTRLRSDLGDAAAERLLRRLDEDVSRVVSDHDGTVVKGTGDGQLLTFGSATHALLAAAEIRRAALGIRLRMGISAGDVRRDHADIYGTPAAEAARLCGDAAPGEILITDLVRLLAGTWHALDLRPGGVRDLRGLDRPLTTWVLEADVRSSGRSAVLLVDDQFPFVGRSAELAELERLWHMSLTGWPTLALLGGEPGVGKSRLVVEFAQVVPTQAVVMAGSCERHGGHQLAPILEALEGHFRSMSSADLNRRVGSSAPVLARAIPTLVSAGVLAAADLADPSLEEHRLSQAVVEYVSNAAGQSPVLFVIDDIQWAGEPTKHLLSRMFRQLRAARLMVVATYRDTADDLDPETATWIRTLARSTGGTTISLGGLSKDDVDLLTGAALGAERAEVSESVFTLTGGNGLFTTEVLRQLAGGDAGGVPASVADAVADRLARLPPAVGALLTTGSLMGSTFDVGVAAAATDLPEHEAFEAMSKAAGARLVLERDADAYQFTHALIAAALHDRLTEGERAKLHGRIAAVLDSAGAEKADVARHLVMAVPAVERAEARGVAVEAAEEAFASFRFDDAARLFGLAVSVADDASSRCELLIRQGESWNEYGNPVYGVNMFREAFELAAANHWWEAMARSALGIWGNDPWRANRSTEVLGLLASSTAHLDRLPIALAAEIVAQQASFSIFTESLDRRRELADSALEMLGPDADLDARHRVLMARWVALACPATLELVAAMDVEIEEIRRRLGRTAEHGAASPDVAFTWRADGDALRRFRESLMGTDHPTRDIDIWRNESLNATVALIEGRTDEARLHADAARDAGVDAWNDTAAAMQVYIHAFADRLDGVPGRSAESLTSLADAVGGSVVRLLAGWAQADSGGTAQAAYIIGRVGERRLRALPEFFLGSMGLAGAAGIALAIDDDSWTRVVYETMQPLESQICGIPWAPLPAAAHYLGLLARRLGAHEAAERHFDVARVVHDRFGAPGFHKYSEKVRHGWRGLAA